VLSVRLSADEFDRLTALATEVGVGPSTLARTLIRRGLTTTPPTEGAASVLERSLIEHLPHPLAALEELAARVAALEAWVASHPEHDER
jgi:hypothetical protein